MGKAEKSASADAVQPTEVTKIISEFGAGLAYADIPETVKQYIRLATLDGLGCCLVGAQMPWTKMVADLARAEGGTPEARLIGLDGAVPLTAAALVNATAGHAFELDDIHRDSIVHPNSLAVPVALNTAETLCKTVSGKDLLTAIVAGYEVGTRIGMAAGTDLLLRGFHPQGTGGAFVAAAACARMKAVSAAAFQNALGVAGSLGAGLMAAQEGAMVKRLHSGNAACNGVRAVLLAERGFTGISDVVEAEYGGFVAAFAGTADMSAVTRDLGSHWETAQTGIKPHATVTSIHCALDALLTILTEHKLKASDIAKIHVRVSTPTYVHCAWKYTGQSVTAAQMNLFYGLSMIALDGRAFVDQFTEARIRDPRVLEFIEKIEAEKDPDIDSRGRAYRHMARVRVDTTDMRSFSHEEAVRRGSPQKPVADADIIGKFEELAGPVLGKDGTRKAIDMCAGLDDLKDIGPLMDLVSGQG